MPFLHPFAHRGEERRHAVYGEHPDGSIPCEFEFPPAEGVQSRKCNFKAPAEDAAVDKIMDYFSHASSVAVSEWKYSMRRQYFCPAGIYGLLRLMISGGGGELV